MMLEQGGFMLKKSWRCSIYGKLRVGKVLNHGYH